MLRGVWGGGTCRATPNGLLDQQAEQSCCRVGPWAPWPGLRGPGQWEVGLHGLRGSLGVSITCDTVLPFATCLCSALSELPYLILSAPYEVGNLGLVFADQEAGAPEVKQLASLGEKGTVALGASLESAWVPLALCVGVGAMPPPPAWHPRHHWVRPGQHPMPPTPAWNKSSCVLIPH